MTLTHRPPAGPAPTDAIDLTGDEIIDLTDRRRVLLHTVLGLDVDPQTADAVFTDGGRVSRPAPATP